MKAAEREAARQRIRELTELALKRQRRANRLIVLRTVAGLVGFAVGFPLIRSLVRHESFDVATMGLAAVSYTTVTALIWGGFLAWDRWRHRRRAA